MKYADCKTALITGASSGIGLEFALRLASKGILPVLTSRDEDQLQAIAERIKSDFGMEPIVIVKDLSVGSSARELFVEIIGMGLEIDILINNAGFGYFGPFLNADADTYERMTYLNMTALTNLSRYFAEGMASRKKGGILNVASMAGFGPVPGFGVYAATKSYVIKFTQSLWYEMKKHGVHVSALCPGPVDTNFFDVAGIKPGKLRMRRIQQAGEVAEIGLKALEKNVPVAPTSAYYKLMAVSTRLVPSRLIMAVSAKMMGG